jgi:hypothetical protein
MSQSKIYKQKEVGSTLNYYFEVLFKYLSQYSLLTTTNYDLKDFFETSKICFRSLFLNTYFFKADSFFFN